MTAEAGINFDAVKMLRVERPISIVLTFQPSHIGTAGSQAARAFCTTAARALRGGHLALTVGSVQMKTTPKESRGVGAWIHCRRDLVSKDHSRTHAASSRLSFKLLLTSSNGQPRCKLRRGDGYLQGRLAGYRKPA
jgi:hypothetical protein